MTKGAIFSIRFDFLIERVPNIHSIMNFAACYHLHASVSLILVNKFINFQLFEPIFEQEFTKPVEIWCAKIQAKTKKKRNMTA